ncbi:citrate synthase [Colletotrichum kahawae]|uniref:Citrate synthase n=1 Tax=Colletotrichum kahawae TaxID=34407 RepID=A0AAD9Y6R2_COLKA|nr:citrate synthase [Colletotrichum kahawae]
MLVVVPFANTKHCSQDGREHLWSLECSSPRNDTSSGTLTVRDNRTDLQYQIPITQNAINAIDVGRIVDPSHQGQSGLRIFDPGYLNTACTKSSITFIDGQRGYIQGELPDKSEKEGFQRKLAASCVPPDHVIRTIASFSRDSPTSTMMIAGIAAYASHDEGAISTMGSAKPAYLGRAGQVDGAIIRCISALATVVALVYCHKRGKDLTPADPNDSLVANVLWILYADHEMTNSTAAFLHAASTLTDPLSCCISGIVSGYGPLHGGAIDLAYKTFEKIKTPSEVCSHITDVKENKERLYGYGHRIYKTVDPRVKLIHRIIDQHREKVESNPMLAVALEIDRVANDDEYFTSRNLKANADLYGCFLYTAMGFETDIIVAMATLSRTAGVLAHWREAMLEKGPTLWRPKQIFTGKVFSPTVKT